MLEHCSRMELSKSASNLAIQSLFSIRPLKGEVHIQNSKMENGIFNHDTLGGKSSMNCLQLLLLLTRRIMDSLNAPCLRPNFKSFSSVFMSIRFSHFWK